MAAKTSSIDITITAIIIITMIIIIIIMALAQNPISTKSHIWDFVHLYGIVSVIITIVIVNCIILLSIRSLSKHLHTVEPLVHVLVLDVLVILT